MRIKNTPKLTKYYVGSARNGVKLATNNIKAANDSWSADNRNGTTR